MNGTLKMFHSKILLESIWDSAMRKIVCTETALSRPGLQRHMLSVFIAGQYSEHPNCRGRSGPLETGHAVQVSAIASAKRCRRIADSAARPVIAIHYFSIGLSIPRRWRKPD